jgi:HD-GYP domain-containing protein (c-di-GMP phosphodiesterase class II)
MIGHAVTAPPSGTEEATEGALRHAGRDLLVGLHAALRSLKLYPLENAQVQHALDHLFAVTTHILECHGELELRLQGEFLFVNATRLRLELDSFAFSSHVFGLFTHCGIGVVRIHPGVDRRQLQILASLLISYAAKEADPETVAELEQKLDEAGVTCINVGPPQEHGTEESTPAGEERKEGQKGERKQAGKEEGEAGANEGGKAGAKRTYARSVAATKEVINGIRVGRVGSIKKVKRVVQGIVDQVLNDETSLIGLTTLRDYDEYTFTHSVNVCIFAVALGRKLGLTKPQLCDLGLAALLHDVGKSRVPLEVLNKEGGFSEEDWRLMQSHPWLGVLTLFSLRGQGDMPFRPMIVAYEHHMKTDLTGYPKSIRPRAMSILSKIVAVADSFDAATRRRVYRTKAVEPDQVLKEMWQDRWRGHDPVVVKAFITLMGIYPVGTCVILDTHELGIVHAANPDASQVSRPVVRIIADREGTFQSPGSLADLAQRDEQGHFTRTIIKVTDPEKLGIKVSDYFV